MEKEDFKKGDKVRIKKFKVRPNGWNDQGEMDEWMGKEVTIEVNNSSGIRIKEASRWIFNFSDFEPISNIGSDSNEVLICHK